MFSLLIQALFLIQVTKERIKPTVFTFWQSTLHFCIKKPQCLCKKEIAFLYKQLFLVLQIVFIVFFQLGIICRILTRHVCWTGC